MSWQFDTKQPTGDTSRALLIRLLGPPRVVWAGRSLALLRRQVRALTYCLAAALHPVPRQQLCYLFWADAPEAMARRNLRGLLAHLRRALPGPDLLITGEDVVRLDPERTWSDAKAFERLCTTPEPALRLERLQEAINLYRGPFLAGFSLPGCPEYDTWLSTERQSLERLYLETLATLVEEHAARRQYAAAIACAQRHLATDALAEDIHRRLIELYAASGDRGAALRQFEECAAVLERELGVTPLPETQTAYQAALAGQTALSSRTTARPTWTTLPGLEVPQVGRDGAMRQLEQAFARACAGCGAVVLISGEAGIGKSRMLQEFATRIQDQALILVGCGYPDAQTMPYQPIVEALRPALGIQQLTPAVQAAWLAEASRLLPELRDLYPGLPSPLLAEADQARTNLFEALCQLTRGLAAGLVPVLFCLDDLHWADGTTLDWLAHLGRKLHGNRLLILGTFRSEEASGVARLRHSLARQGILSELRLERLDEGAILQLLRNFKDSAPSDKARASQLYQSTGGNPFFLLETLRALLESGLLERGALDDLGDLPLPTSIQAAVKARVERLSAQARQVLEAGAVLGHFFSFDLVHLTAGRRELETMDGLDELVARQLVRENDNEYGFCHEVIRTAVYRSLSPARRCLLHRRAGEALAQLKPQEAASLARHFEGAGELGRAARYALEAGRAAREVFAHVEARVCFERGLVWLQQEATALRHPEDIAENHRLQIRALYEQGWAYRLVGDMEAYARDLEKVACLAHSLDDPGTLAHLRWRQAYTYGWFCRYVESRQAAEEGIRLSLAAADRRLEAMCRRAAGLAARETGDYRQAQDSLERALVLYVELNDTEHEIHVLGNLSTLSWYVGEYDNAMALARRASARCDEAGLPFHRRLPLGDMGVAAAAMGDTDLALHCLRESLMTATKAADRTQEIFCLMHLGWLCVNLGQPDEALEHLQAGLAIARQIGSCAEQSQLLSGLAETHRLAGEWKKARDCALQALERAKATGRPFDEGLARRVLYRLDQG